MRLIWSESGDYLDIDVGERMPLLEYWADNLPSTEFILSKNNIPYNKIDRYIQSLNDINSLLKTKLNIRIFDYDEIKFDQSFLNQVHKDWATIQEQYTSLPILLEKIGPDVLQKFYDINLMFHDFEDDFILQYTEKNSVTQFTHQIVSPDNIEDYTEHGKSHLYFQYWSLGRSEYDAWLHNDTVCKVNNFSHLPFSFNIHLNKPFKLEYPNGYKEWCQKQNKKVSGSYLPIGNFTGYENNLRNLYEIFLKNTKIEQDIILRINYGETI